MNILLLCILINGLIGIIFKLFGKYNIHTFHAILINYFICVLSGIALTGDLSMINSIFKADYLWVSILLGMCFITIFNAYALAVQKSGVGIATIFQKMSLVAPVIVATQYYGEPVGILKIIGVVLSIMALIFLSISKKDQGQRLQGVGLLILVFVGSCIIDVTLYLAEEEALAPGADIAFVASIFLFAGIFGLIYSLFKAEKSLLNFKVKSFMAGIALGVPNFLSIYLLLLVISRGWDGSIVFPANNVGVLTIASIAGVVFFKESITARKVAGFTFAITSIILLALSK